jgi:hypothetical protein
MKRRDDENRTQPSVQVLLDGEPVALSGETLESLAAVRAQLEMIALRQDRVLADLLVDGIAVSLPHAAAWSKSFRKVQANTITFSELGKHMAETAARQVTELQGRVEDISTVVLINEWPNVQLLLQEMEFELRTMLIVISFLHELCGPVLAGIRLEGQSLTDHLDKLGMIRSRLLAAQQTRDEFAISNTLELRLAPWLYQLGKFLTHVNESSISES